MRKLFFALLCCLPALAIAQMPHAWDFGGALGLSAYQGDLQALDYNFYKSVKPVGGLHLRRNVANPFALRLNLSAGLLGGDETLYDDPAYHKQRGLSFSSPLVELALLGEIYPFGMYQKTRNAEGQTQVGARRRKIAPFLTVGLGGAFTKPKVDWNETNGTNPALNPARVAEDKNAQLSAINLTVPLGAGLRLRLNDRLTLGGEALLRPSFSDLLDGVSAAGNPGENDWFLTGMATLSYAFGHDKPRKPRLDKPEEPSTPKPVASGDRDSDGIPDDKDECPDAAGYRNMKGCPDTDRDGIADHKDACPDQIGREAFKGCPDTDDDGIPDKDDGCPTVPGSPAYRGCPAVDRDKDGIADGEDLCPDMPGLVQWKGCPDSDGDGLPDNKDACPGIVGLAALNGCPDADNDGIADKDDDCPTVPGNAAKKGCPDAMPPAPGVPYKAVYFSSTLKDWQVTSLITLDEAVAILASDPTLNARIEGHTDNTGEEPANDLLSEQRARRVYEYLISKGIEAKRLLYSGLGSDRPAASNETLQGRQLNRRVEIHFTR